MAVRELRLDVGTDIEGCFRNLNCFETAVDVTYRLLLKGRFYRAF